MRIYSISLMSALMVSASFSGVYAKGTLPTYEDLSRRPHPLAPLNKAIAADPTYKAMVTKAAAVKVAPAQDVQQFLRTKSSYAVSAFDATRKTFSVNGLSQPVAIQTFFDHLKNNRSLTTLTFGQVGKTMGGAKDWFEACDEFLNGRRSPLASLTFMECDFTGFVKNLLSGPDDDSEDDDGDDELNVKDLVIQEKNMPLFEALMVVSDIRESSKLKSYSFNLGSLTFKKTASQSEPDFDLGAMTPQQARAFINSCNQNPEITEGLRQEIDDELGAGIIDGMLMHFRGLAGSF